MRPFMDGIIENKVGNSLDSSLENRERERHWSHWRLRIINLAVTETEIGKPLCILISDSRIDDLSYIFLSFPHIFNLTSSTFFQSKVFPHLSYVYCRCSFSFLTSHIQTQTTFHLVVSPRDLGTAPTKRGSQAIGRNEFAFYFRSLVSKNRLKIGHSKTDGPRQLPIQLPKMVKCEDACLEIFAKKTTTEKTRVFLLLKELRI